MTSPATLEPRPVPAAAEPTLHLLDITDFWSETASGGVKTYLRAKSEHLARHGIRHTIVVPGSRDGVEEFGPSRIVRIRGPRIPVSTDYRVILSSEAVRTVIQKADPDVIEVGSPFLVPRLVRRAVADSPRPALVGFYHADIVRTYAEPYVPHRIAAPLRVAARMAARRLIRSVYSRFDLTVAASISVVRELRELGVPRVEECSLGVDLEVFRPDPEGGAMTRPEMGIPDDGRPIGVFAGRFCAEKRLDVVLDGHARLPEATRPHLLLVGDGPHRDRFEARTGGHPGLHLLPYQSSRGALARIYAGADFYLAAGPGETFGLSIAEGMAAGLPLLVVDRAAAPDRLGDSGAGERYLHGDAVDCARAMRRLTERLLAGEPLPAAARAHAERSYDWSRTFDRMIELYRAVVPASRRPAPLRAG